jgi:branched-chain amino acid transport system substrate-binding protein
MARFARERLGVKRAAMLYDVSNDYSRDLATVFREQFESRGGRIVSDERFTTDAASDFRPQLRRIQASGAEVIFAPSYLDADSTQLVQSRELGMRITFLGPDSWDAGLMKHFADLQEVYLVSPWHGGIDTPESVRFSDRYTERYGNPPGPTAASTYDAVMILAEAITRAGIEPESIRAGLAATQHRGATGELSFPTGGDPRRSAYILRPTRRGPILVEQVQP